MSNNDTNTKDYDFLGKVKKLMTHGHFLSVLSFFILYTMKSKHTLPAFISSIVTFVAAIGIPPFGLVLDSDLNKAHLNKSQARPKPKVEDENKEALNEKVLSKKAAGAKANGKKKK
mmetsp:Transcript_36029/g.43035  ORF Transcript_36029/g.43035 Transcript_36029/m.43035 type:complete len:116 (+) Transcript_36029:117-464(+)